MIMLLVEYYGWQGPFYKNFARELKGFSANKLSFYAQLYTTLSFSLFFIFLPTVLVRGIFKNNLHERGLKLPSLEDARPYLLIGLVMTVVLTLACSTPGFYQFYPLYKPQKVSDWIFFECIYAFQFLGVEYFFRGPLLFNLYDKMKDHAILIMTIPYALLHIHKPFPEAVGSIVAGIILGKLALKSRSIWWGVSLHIYIALLADFLGLFYSGKLGMILN